MIRRQMSLSFEKNRMECLLMYKTIEVRTMAQTYLILEKCPHKKEMQGDIDHLKQRCSDQLKKVKFYQAEIEKIEPEMYSLTKKEIEANERMGKVKTRDKAL